MLTIGLFGTCGGSKWRDLFMAKYDEVGIDFFNSQVDDQKPELAEIEAEHLAKDDIVLFPVTGETYGTGSLAEVGFSILNAIKLDDRRFFIIMIEKELDEKLDNAVACKESLRSRALVLQHLKKLAFSNVYFVESLDEMLELSLKLHDAAKICDSVKHQSLVG